MRRPNPAFYAGSRENITPIQSFNRASSDHTALTMMIRETASDLSNIPLLRNSNASSCNVRMRLVNTRSRPSVHSYFLFTVSWCYTNDWGERWPSGLGWWPSGLGRRPATGRSMVRVPLRKNFSLWNFGNSVYPALPVSFG